MASCVAGEGAVSGEGELRFSIARAIFHNPRILIIVEAIASVVDTEPEQQFQEAISPLVKRVYAIAIARRLLFEDCCAKPLEGRRGRHVGSARAEGSASETGSNGRVCKQLRKNRRAITIRAYQGAISPIDSGEQYL